MGFYGNDATAANNTAVNGIGSQGTSSPANIDNLIRELAAQGKQFALDLGGPTAGGTADALTLTLNDTVIAAYFDDMLVGAQIASDNTLTTSTLNVNGIGAKVIKKAVAGVETAILAGDLQAGAYVLFRYRSAWDSAGGAWELLQFAPITPQFTTIELGHATDTTLSRNSAGRVQVETDILASFGGINVFTAANYLVTADNTPESNSGNNPATYLSGAAGTISIAAYQSAGLAVNRLNDDGAIVALYQDGTLEGSISVSGTTVSYNGGHLSRWSQWDGDAPAAPLRGTVVSNADAMCVWKELSFTTADGKTKKAEYHGDGNPGDVIAYDHQGEMVEATIALCANDQLNKITVSSAIADRNIAGVLEGVDEHGEPTVAQSGDFVCRIGAGLVVARGDLLESNGDGTARPQADDFVRSSTIGKVSSAIVTHTYPDGSYLLPVTLMAGG